MKERTPKQEKAFQEQLKKDQRRFHITQRYQLVRDAVFLINQATHRLQDSIKYYDCSKNPDFDDLHHNVYHARSFIDFAMEKLEEIAGRDYEFGCDSHQIHEELERGRTPKAVFAEIDAKIEEANSGRRKRIRSRKDKKGSQGKQKVRKN